MRETTSIALGLEKNMEFRKFLIIATTSFIVGALAYGAFSLPITQDFFDGLVEPIRARLFFAIFLGGVWSYGLASVLYRSHGEPTILWTAPPALLVVPAHTLGQSPWGMMMYLIVFTAILPIITWGFIWLWRYLVVPPTNSPEAR